MDYAIFWVIFLENHMVTLCASMYTKEMLPFWPDDKKLPMDVWIALDIKTNNIRSSRMITYYLFKELIKDFFISGEPFEGTNCFF
jgi:hypothetical protein